MLKLQAFTVLHKNKYWKNVSKTNYLIWNFKWWEIFSLKERVMYAIFFNLKKNISAYDLQEKKKTPFFEYALDFNIIESCYETLYQKFAWTQKP